jgi:hypothetical protein
MVWTEETGFDSVWWRFSYQLLCPDPFEDLPVSCQMDTRSNFFRSKTVRDIHLTMAIKPPGKWISIGSFLGSKEVGGMHLIKATKSPVQWAPGASSSGVKLFGIFI